ncbi:MAG TPA: hypothetical protein VLZ12_11775 [Verrucomicrobiae bacterium]|nr:hypothetical protein [Verrucomicrobiae bacterium]
MNYSTLLGVALGTIIGGVFAWLQLQALYRNELLEKRRQLPMLLRQIPGSGVRVAFLLMALALVQVLVPTADKWWLTGSLAVSYGIPFLWRLRHLRSPAR